MFITEMRKFRIGQDFLIERWHMIYIMSVVSPSQSFFFQLPRSLPKFLTRLPFFPVLVLTILLVPGSDSHFILNNC